LSPNARASWKNPSNQQDLSRNIEAFSFVYIAGQADNHWYSKRAFALLLTSKSEVNDEGEIVHNIGE
jgi:hypothetical protein